MASHELSHHELSSLYRTILRDDFLQQFILGPSFCEDHRQKLVHHLLSSRPIVLDAYLACALSFEDNAAETQAGKDDGYEHAAAALVTLRSITVQNKLDITSCLILGWQMLHFVLRVGGSEMMDICTQTLSLVKPHFDANIAIDNSYSTFLTSLVLSETAESLLKTQLPTLRLYAPASHTQIDGCVGICATILPYMHDLAVLNFELQQCSTDTIEGETHMLALMTLLERLEGQITQWHPQIPDEFCNKYTTTEVIHMMGQAHTMRTACMLIIHRLRYSYGVNDDTALALSSTILAQLDMALLATGKILHAVDLPLIVACLEVEDDEDRAAWLMKFSPIGSYSGRFHGMMKRRLDLVWEARRRLLDMRWFDLGSIIGPTP